MGLHCPGNHFTKITLTGAGEKKGLSGLYVFFFFMPRHILGTCQNEITFLILVKLVLGHFQKMFQQNLCFKDLRLN